MRRLAILTLVSSLVGCASDPFVPPSDDGGAPDAAGAPDGALDAAAESDAADTGPADVAGDGCAPVAWYLDGDADGVGGTTSVQACTAPTPAWVAVGGDCDDTNPDVHPGQTTFFAASYVPTGKSDPSFDYDCDGQETESGASPKGGCSVVSLACVGAGYLVAQPVRSGVGVDPYCGSTLAITCAFQSLVCKASAPQSATAIGCR